MFQANWTVIETAKLWMSRERSLPLLSKGFQFFRLFFVCFYLFRVHIIHTAVNSLEGIQKTCMYLVQRNLEGYVLEAIVIISLKRKPLS